MRYGGRLHAVVLSAAILGAALAPLVWPGFEDDFPLSDYPMFSHVPRTPVVAIDHVVGWSEGGDHRPVEPALVDTEEVMQAMQTIHVAVVQGPGPAGELCRRVASRVRDDDDYADITVLEVRTDWYDVFEYFERGGRPRRTSVVARCAVGEGGR